MFEKLPAVEDRFEKIQKMLSDPEVTSDIGEYTKLMKELSSLTPVVEKYRQWVKAEDDGRQAKALLEEGGQDPELKELASEELEEARQNALQFAEELKVLLLPKDPNDDRNVILEIRAGTGGEEAALFAGTLFRMYSMYAENKGFHIDVLNENATELGGFKEISVEITGQGAYSRFKFESGVHRVQRVPETESQGRIQTSTATVAVLPEAEDVDVDLDMNDIQIDTFRSSGAGGHAHSHRNGGGVPGRAEPAQEQGSRPENSPLPPSREGAGETARGNCRTAPGNGRHRRPLRAHSHL